MRTNCIFHVLEGTRMILYGMRIVMMKPHREQPGAECEKSEPESET